MAIGVNNFGLLSITHADTVNKINEIASNIAMDVATASLGAGFVPQSTTPRSALVPSTIPSPNPFSPPIDSSIKFDVDKSCPIGSYSLLIDPKDINKPSFGGGTADRTLTQQINIEQLSNIPYKEICGIKLSIVGLFPPEFENYRDSKRIESIDAQDNLEKAKYYGNYIHNIFSFHSHNRGNSLPGVFYKQDLPYMVSVWKDADCAAEKAAAKKCADKNTSATECASENTAAKVCADTVRAFNNQDVKARFIALSPNESKIYFAPITRTLFTDNTSDITLTNGVVSTLRENTDSELLALAKIPSAVLGAYTSAVGQTFSSLGTALASRNSYQTAQSSIDQSSYLLNKVMLCQAAMNNASGKTGDALTTAIGYMQAVCKN